MRVLATFSAAFAAGVFLAQYLLPVSLHVPAAVLCFGVALLAGLLLQKYRKRLLLIGCGLLLALLWNQFFICRVQQPMEALAQNDRFTEMTLCAYPTPTNHGARVPVKLNGITYGKAMYYGDPELLTLCPGQVIWDHVRLESASNIKSDEVTTFTSKGIYLLAYHRDGAPVFYRDGTSESLRWLPLRVAKRMQSQISSLFSGDTAAFMTAILTGDRHLLSEQASADLSEAGLAHILAVSGMHCGFLLALFTFLIGKQHQRLLSLCTIPTLIFYAVLTGGSPSVLRACTMLSLFIFAPLVNRESDGWTSLCFALLLILLQNPFAIASVSLQLSFGAMAGILFFSPRLYQALAGSKKHGKCFHFIAVDFSTTIGALVCTVPLSAIYFNSLVLISPLSNLLCLWAASLIFMLGLIAVVCSLFCMPLAALLAVVPAVLTRSLLKAAHLLASFPFHAVSFCNPYLKYWLAGVYLLFATLLLTHTSRHFLYWGAIGFSAGALALTVSIGQQLHAADLDMTVLDVGQGQCVLLASGGQHALLDCGSSQSWKDPGRHAADQLRSMGCTRLDYLLLTHYDYDHVSGVPALLARLPVDTLLVPAVDVEDDADLRDSILETVSAYPTAVLELDSMETLSLGAADLTIYPPLGKRKDNERGLSCLAAVGDQEILITGDMSAATEKRLVVTYPLPDIEILVASHHGSDSSTCNEFLYAVSPDIVCISAGKGNPHGHPSRKTLQRLKNHACQVYRTDLDGDLHFQFNQGDHNGV